jgi:hypothetical protein
MIQLAAVSDNCITLRKQTSHKRESMSAKGQKPTC